MMTNTSFTPASTRIVANFYSLAMPSRMLSVPHQFVKKIFRDFLNDYGTKSLVITTAGKIHVIDVSVVCANVDLAPLKTPLLDHLDRSLDMSKAISPVCDTILSLNMGLRPGVPITISFCLDGTPRSTLTLLFDRLGHMRMLSPQVPSLRSN